MQRHWGMRKQILFGNLLCPRTQGVLWGMSQGTGGCQLDWGLNVPLRGSSFALLALPGRQKLAPKGDICRPHGPSSWTGGGEAQGESQVTVVWPGSGQSLWGGEDGVCESPLATEGPASLGRPAAVCTPGPA